MVNLQELIHKLEVGPGMRYVRMGLAILALVGLVVGYNWRNFRNLNTQEAMDAAQVARNVSQGKGYSTLFIRQSSLRLIQEHGSARAVDGDPVMLKGYHPDLANAPVYPLVLAAYMKIMPMHWDVRNTGPFWSANGQMWRHQPDFLIALFNQGLFFGVIALTFLLARRLFDPAVAWTSALLLLACDVMWQFSISGLSTMLLILIFLGLIWLLVLFESEIREPKFGPRAPFLLLAGIGALLGVGMMTRYSFGWLLLPALAYVIIFGGARRGISCAILVVVFTVLVTPWMFRNMRLSGLPFGTATYAAIQDTPAFPQHLLDRSLKSGLDRNGVSFSLLTRKLTVNARDILQKGLPQIGGSWLTALFLAGLLMGFRNPAIQRLRYFILMGLLTLIIVQALGRTQLSDDSPELNSENLLVLLVPVVFIYGVALFFQFLDTMSLPFQGFRAVVIGLFGVIVSLPMLFAFLPPRPLPVTYPPYNPFVIQHVSRWMKENEMLMSDLPWAVAWYGQRQCLWLSRDPAEEFFAVNDLMKPVRALYLTQLTLDTKFVSEWLRPGSWGTFVLESVLVKRTFPASFPLREASPGFLPQQLFLTDWKRWEGKAPLDVPLAPPETEPAKEKKAAEEKAK